MGNQNLLAILLDLGCIADPPYNSSFGRSKNTSKKFFLIFKKVLGLFACVVGAQQKWLLKYERALKNTSKNPSYILLTFHFKQFFDWRSQNPFKKYFLLGRKKYYGK